MYARLNDLSRDHEFSYTVEFNSLENNNFTDEDSDDDDDEEEEDDGGNGDGDGEYDNNDDHGYEFDNEMLDEDDNISEASTVLNEGHQQPTQSGTDTEVEEDGNVEEVREIEVARQVERNRTIEVNGEVVDNREIIENREVEEEPIVQSQKKIKLDEPESVLVQNIANESIDEDQKCPICLEIWSNAGEHRLCSLRCGHLFGLKCITQWFNVAQNATARKCPECNTKASKKDIRVLYAKKLQCIDTAEIERLKEQLKDACEKRDFAEKELLRSKLKEIFYQQEINYLKKRINVLTENLNASSSGQNLNVKNENISLEKIKVFDICSNSSCRVMAYNPWHDILVASSGNGISKIFMECLTAVPNYNIHKGPIRDLAFQEKYPNYILSVGFDKKVILTDIRNNVAIHSYQEETNLWSCCWSNFTGERFFVGGTRGTISEYDIRKLDKAVCKISNSTDRSPVVSLASVPVGILSFRQNFLACQLNSCFAYGSEEGTYVGTKMNIEGPFTSLRYNDKYNYILLSCRASAKKPYVRHVVCTMDKVENEIQFYEVHTFEAGNTQKLLSRPCYMNLKNDTFVVANNESENSVTTWSMSTGREAYSIPIHEPVVDVCSFQTNAVYQAILTWNKLYLYNNKSTNVVQVVRLC